MTHPQTRQNFSTSCEFWHYETNRTCVIRVEPSFISHVRARKSCTLRYIFTFLLTADTNHQLVFASNTCKQVTLPLCPWHTSELIKGGWIRVWQDAFMFFFFLFRTVNEAGGLLSVFKRSAWSSWAGRSVCGGTWGCKGADSSPAWWRSPSTGTTPWWWSICLARTERQRSERGCRTETNIQTLDGCACNSHWITLILTNPMIPQWSSEVTCTKSLNVGDPTNKRPTECVNCTCKNRRIAF